MPRDISHFEGLLQLLELERSEQKSRSAELRGTLPLGELEQKGLVVLDLESVEEAIGLGGRFLITFERSDKRPFAMRLHNGDLVELRPRRSEDSASASGTISRATRTRVQIAFDRAPPPFVSDSRLRLDLVPNDVTFDRARDAVRAVAAMDRGQVRHTRDVLLAQAPPQSDPPAPLEPTRALNPEQHVAVTRALAAEDFFLVHGPPGTGKSTVLIEVAVQAVKRGERVLATAASNAAVDHLLALCLDAGLRAVRVGHPARISPALQDHALDVLVESEPDRIVARDLFDEAFDLLGYARKQRRQGRTRARFANARESSAEARRLLDEARALERKAVQAVLGRAQVICATLSSADSGPLSGSSFEWALIDEATQAIEPLTLIGFLKAPRRVLAGDHQQLPPTVLSMKAAERGLKRSLFERLLADHGDTVKQMLAEQHRMSEAIQGFPSSEMYGGKLRAHRDVARRTLAEVLRPDAAVDAPPVLFLDTAGKGFDDASREGEESRFNEGEAALVIARARELLAAGIAPSELAIIAPYSAQAALIRERLDLPDIEVDTVDAFQGREKDAVLISLTRSNPEGAIGFLSDLRRMNVALTRARRHVFAVGDSATLSQHPFYARFIEATQKAGGYRSAWEWPDPTPSV